MLVSAGVNGFVGNGGPTGGLAQVGALGGHCGYVVALLPPFKLVGLKLPDEVRFPRDQILTPYRRR